MVLTCLVVSICLAIGGVIGHVIGATTGSHRFKLTSKMIASTGFLLLGITQNPWHSTSGTIIFFGLVLCWLGDLYLELSGEASFLIGLISFLAGHAAFMIAFFWYGFAIQWFIWAVLIQAITSGMLYYWMKPHLPADMKHPVQFYIIIISLMVAFASGLTGSTNQHIFLTAAVLFAISDITVARQRFIKPGIANTIIGIPLYYLSVCLIAFSISLLK